MTTLSTITAGEILTVYMITDDLQVPDDYDYCEKVKASLLLKGYYCTKIDYEQHIEFLVDSDILGRGQFGKVYFAMSDNNPNKSDIDIAIIIYEKLKTFTNSITHHHPPYPTPPQSPEEIYANGKIWESGDDEFDSDCDSDCEIVSNISIIDDNPEGESINSIIDDDTQQSSKNVFFVKSFSTPNRKYVVSIQPDGDLNCSCPHNQYTNSYCKHMNHLYISYYTDSDNIKNPTLYNALVKKQEYSDNKIVHKPPSTPGILQSSKYYVKDYIITVDSNTTTFTCCDVKYRGPNRFCKHMAFIYPDISSFSKHLIDNFYHSCGDNVYE